MQQRRRAFTRPPVHIAKMHDGARKLYESCGCVCVCAHTVHGEEYDVRRYEPAQNLYRWFMIFYGHTHTRREKIFDFVTAVQRIQYASMQMAFDIVHRERIAKVHRLANLA